MLDEIELKRLYIDEQLTGPEIAEIVDVKSSQTIYNWMDKYDIPRRQRRAAQHPIEPDEDTLRRLYLDEELGINIIAKQLGSSGISISRLLDNYGIPKRKNWEKINGWNMGKHLTKEQCQHLSEIAKKRPKGKDHPRYGIPLPEETRRKISESLKGRFRGSKNPSWKGGKARYERDIWMNRWEYQEWRHAIFERDDYICQMCDKESTGDIEAHHIKPFADFPKLCFKVDNGITLCKECHLSVKGKELEYAPMFLAILQSNQ